MANMPLAAIERIIKKAGAARVSDDAKRKMGEALEAYALVVAARANQLAKHRKKRTITAEDIALAVSKES